MHTFLGARGVLETLIKNSFHAVNQGKNVSSKPGSQERFLILHSQIWAENRGCTAERMPKEVKSYEPSGPLLLELVPVSVASD